MNVIPFIADSAADAVAQIRERLGPQAVVLNVRRLPASGLSRLWQKSKIEVLACVPETAASTEVNTPIAVAPPGPAKPVSSLLDIREADDAVTLPPPEPAVDFPEPPVRPRPSRFVMPRTEEREWRSAPLLEKMGLAPLHVERVMEELRRRHGQAPESLRSELVLTRNVLASFWRDLPLPARGRHVLVGPPGSGKSTALCKWLTQAVLMDRRHARVWRLDTPRANTAEALSVHCEILNVAVERAWNPSATWPEEASFIDLPGVDPQDEGAMAEVLSLLSTMPGASVSLVLNAAYDSTLLQAQLRAFARLPITHLIFTHLDEETRWSKLWNFVLGTNYTVSFLGAGQNIPGQFLRATPDLLFSEGIRGS